LTHPQPLQNQGLQHKITNLSLFYCHPAAILRGSQRRPQDGHPITTNPTPPNKMKTNSKATEKKIARIATEIRKDKEIMRHINKDNYTTPEDIAEHCLRYVSAVREGRALVNIESVSKSGMSRVMSFYEVAKWDQPMRDGRKFGLLNFNLLFRVTGHTPSGDGFRISGCGMDMVFATNYNLMHHLARLKVITPDQCKKLAQMTPPYV
jgi:hypothetical protein